MPKKTVLQAGPPVSTHAVSQATDASQEASPPGAGSCEGRSVSPVADAACQIPGHKRVSSSQPEETGRKVGRTKDDIVQLHRVADPRLEEYSPLVHAMASKRCEEKLPPLQSEGMTPIHERGQGAAGTVQAVVEGLAGGMKVCKTMPANEDNRKECLLLQGLNHPNIVKARKASLHASTDEFGDRTQEWRLVMTDAGQSIGTLIKFLRPVRRFADGTNKQTRYSQRLQAQRVVLTAEAGRSVTFLPLPMAIIQSSMKQLGSALDYLHNEKNIVHNDIKPANLLINAGGKVTLCDFGLAMDLDDPDNAPHCRQLREAGGTLAYFPPEVCKAISDSGRDCPMTHPRALDSWAWGCTLYEMVFAHVPFDPGYSRTGQETWEEAMLGLQRDRSGLATKIDAHWASLRSQVEGYMTQEQGEQLKDLLMGLLHEQPDQRMTVTQALEHPFLKDAPSLPVV